jgi:hypothetical protein
VPNVMAKFTTFEVPPPGAGLVTVTASVPAEATAAAGMGTDNCVVPWEREMLVVIAVAPKATVEAEVKFVPLIVSVKGALPGKELLGEIAVIVGIGKPTDDESAEVPPVPEPYCPAEPQPARINPERMAYSTMNRGRKTSSRDRSRAGIWVSPVNSFREGHPARQD